MPPAPPAQLLLSQLLLSCPPSRTPLAATTTLPPGRSTHTPPLPRPQRRCGLSHKLEDEDVVQIVKKKIIGGDDARGRFCQQAKEYVRIGDRVKKPALKT